MIGELGLRWIFTLAFAAAGAFCLYRCVRHGTVAHRVCDALHALMCAAMVAMAWPAAMNVARVPQILFFAVAALWFAGMLVAGRGGSGRLSLGHHALMMAGMAWMVLVMPLAMSGTMTSAPASAPASGDHAGMTMGAATTMMGDAPAHVTIVAAVLAVVFLVAGTAWMARAIDAGRGDSTLRLRTAGLVANAVMSLGMALMAAVLV
ncbi:DUF5134 domain-containing protein [Amycolatopsis sp. NPDC051128]|uniref:DUF5134 domain-containing protein n=1 Tax=Amycolatopsis sp. NPDC051128 TaxID=3155412 RepID=UPI00342CD85C